jgi:hypothetical protein
LRFQFLKKTIHRGDTENLVGAWLSDLDERIFVGATFGGTSNYFKRDPDTESSYLQ